jgi:trigger factor
VEEYKTEQSRIVVKREPNCRVELEVFTNGEMVKRARKKAIESVGKDVVHPGFRKGKAPEPIVVKRHGPHIEEEKRRFLADLLYAEAQKEAKVPLLNNNAKIHFELKSANEVEAHLVYSFETEPKIPVVDPKEFKAKAVERPQVGDVEIDEAIHQMLFYYAEWTNEDRPIQEGDYILINLDTDVRVFDHVRFEVSPKRMAEWMRELVIGKKAGDVLKGTSRPDSTATAAEKAEFQPKDVTLTVIKVETAKLPEPNDDFAKKVGAPDATAMRKSITDLLNQRADEKVQNELRDQVNDFLLEKYPFELPMSLVETERKHRFEQLMQNPKFKENWDQRTVEEKETTEKNILQEAEGAVRLFYLSRQIVNDAKISITHKEVQDEARATLRSYDFNWKDQIPKEVFALALSKVILAKAQDYVIEKSA